MKIKNISQDKIALRIKTTKKELYAVSPNYLLIKPDDVMTIDIVYIKKENIDDLSKHKFKIEAILCDLTDLSSTDLIKSFFESAVQKKVKVKGSVCKIGVTHIQQDTLEIKENHVKNEESIFRQVVESTIKEVESSKNLNKV